MSLPTEEIVPLSIQNSQKPALYVPFPDGFSGFWRLVKALLHFFSSLLGTADWLDGDFSAGDLMMVGVLEQVMEMVAAYPNLAAYVARAEDRRAFKRAFAAQLAVFTGQQPR